MSDIVLGDLITSQSMDLADPNFLLNALNLIKENKSRFNLATSRIVYEVRENKLYRNWPGGEFETFEDWGKIVLEKQRAALYAIARVYDVFVIDFKVDVARLANIDFSKLSVVSAHVNEDNLEEMLVLCETESLFNIQKTVRNSEKLKDLEEGKLKIEKFVFEVTELQAETVKEAFEAARELVKSEVPGKVLEYVCADFLCGAALESSESHLARCVAGLEAAFNVEITVKAKEEPITLNANG